MISTVNIVGISNLAEGSEPLRARDWKDVKGIQRGYYAFSTGTRRTVLSKLLMLVFGKPVFESGIRYRIFSRLSSLSPVSANKCSFKSGMNVPFYGRSNASFTDRSATALHNPCNIKSVFKLSTKQSWISKLFRLLNPVATQFQSWVYAHSFAAISGSNPWEAC